MGGRARPNFLGTKESNGECLNGVERDTADHFSSNGPSEHLGANDLQTNGNQTDVFSDDGISGSLFRRNVYHAADVSSDDGIMFCRNAHRTGVSGNLDVQAADTWEVFGEDLSPVQFENGEFDSGQWSLLLHARVK